MLSQEADFGLAIELLVKVILLWKKSAKLYSFDGKAFKSSQLLISSLTAKKLDISFSRLVIAADLGVHFGENVTFMLSCWT